MIRSEEELENLAVEFFKVLAEEETDYVFRLTTEQVEYVRECVYRNVDLQRHSIYVYLDDEIFGTAHNNKSPFSNPHFEEKDVFVYINEQDYLKWVLDYKLSKL